MAKFEVTRVLIVEEHVGARKGLATSIKSFDDLVVIAEASNEEEAMHFCAGVQPNVVLVDITNGFDAATVTRAIRHLYENVQVIVLGNPEQRESINSAQAAGAIGFLGKDASAEQLAVAIRAASAGNAASLRRSNS